MKVINKKGSIKSYDQRYFDVIFIRPTSVIAGAIVVLLHIDRLPDRDGRHNEQQTVIVTIPKPVENKSCI